MISILRQFLLLNYDLFVFWYLHNWPNHRFFQPRSQIMHESQLSNWYYLHISSALSTYLLWIVNFSAIIDVLQDVIDVSETLINFINGNEPISSFEGALGCFVLDFLDLFIPRNFLSLILLALQVVAAIILWYDGKSKTKSQVFIFKDIEIGIYAV